ncbi:MAG: 2'-5' RNA ligase [Hamadaea sp.]|nr:2'-5' RNA ligase [Hamadaea sp.]NUR48254.1 2'-5' RNA ligase [Hamadaea sp.]NUT08705.1 2'-5' RNA ligase [Hamadaea sp.]
MVTLTDLFPAGALQAALDAGHLRTQTHPELPLVIYNYTEKCAYEDAWDETTLTCRGLIVHAETGEIVARPYRKFFNHGQSGAPTLALDEAVEVTDKADGSLGILYPVPDGYAVATRGSFASDQAVRATTLLRKRYPDWTPPAGQTVLFEIIYPENRIVVDYGGMEDLVLLGAVDTVSGRTFGPDQVAWPGPRVETFAYATFGAALAAPARPNREGLVVHALATGDRVKIKYDDYLRLHRIVTGLTSRAIWEALVAGATVAEICEPLPDEFHGWARDVADRLHAFVDAGVADVEQAFAEIVRGLPADYSRKDFALVAARHDLRGLLFARLDERDLRPALWHAAKPEAGETPHGRSFDDE